MRGLFSQIIASSYQSGYTPRVSQTNLIASYDPAFSGSYPGSGSSLFDLKSNYDVTLYNSPVYNPSGWFDFDGVIEYANSFSSTYSTDALTVGGWVNFDNLSGTQVIFGFGNRSNLEGLILYAANTGIFGRVEDGAANVAQTQFGGLSSTTWYYIVAKWDGTQVKLYRYSSSSTPTTGTLNNNTLSLSSNPVNIGTYFTMNDFYLEGLIGEVHIYDAALSDATITANYNSTKARYGY